METALWSLNINIYTIATITITTLNYANTGLCECPCYSGTTCMIQFKMLHTNQGLVFHVCQVSPFYQGLTIVFDCMASAFLFFPSSNLQQAAIMMFTSVPQNLSCATRL